MKKPKILLVTDVFGWGGAERAKKIKEHLSDEFDFDIVDAAGLHKFEEESDTMFIKWKTLENMRLQRQPKFTKQYICLQDIIAHKAKTKIRERDYDLYYLMFHTMLCWQEIKRIQYCGGKILSVVTGMPVVKETFANDKEFGLNGTRAFAELCNRSVAVAANNMISLDDLQQIYSGPTYYIPRGVDPELFYNQGYNIVVDPGDPQQGKAQTDNFTCVFVGKAHSGKGLKRFIEPVCKDLGINLIINERNYTNALPKPKMCALYNQAHVYCVMSVTDGTPNPALEAAACGRPIIANRIGNMPEFIKDGYNGFLIERTQEDLHRRLLYLKTHHERAKQMGRNARKTILEGWTWKHVMERERKMLREILS